MKVHFYGAAGQVTGSCYVIETEDGRNIMVDCGMRQGKDDDEMPNDEFQFDPAIIDVVLLTHAHIDHSGRVPLLVKRGFKGKVIATTATADLCTIMLPDSGHIQEMEIEWVNRKRMRAGKEPLEPLYTVKDAQDALKAFVGMHYDIIQEILPGVKVRFNDAGHLLGSSSIELWIKEDEKTTKLVFSGDLGMKDKPIIRDPQTIEEADFLFVESTYGDRLHKTPEDPKLALVDIIKRTFKRGGNVVIPSFAVGRTQELLYIINEILRENLLPEYPHLPVYVDSPLAIAATEIFLKEDHQYYDHHAMAAINQGYNPIIFASLHTAQTAEESKQINDIQGSKIIISSSGMCEAGRIKHHLKHNLWRSESSVVFVGYQAVGTLGRKIVEGASKVRIFGEEVNIQAEICKVEGFSGHADQRAIMDWIGSFRKPPTNVFVVHGEVEASKTLAELIEKKLQYRTVLPKIGQTFDLVSLQPVPELITAVSADVQRASQQASAQTAAKLFELNSRIAGLLALNEATADKRKEDYAEQLAQMLNDLQGFYDKWAVKLQ